MDDLRSRSLRFQQAFLELSELFVGCELGAVYPELALCQAPKAEISACIRPRTATAFSEELGRRRERLQEESPVIFSRWHTRRWRCGCVDAGIAPRPRRHCKAAWLRRIGTEGSHRQIALQAWPFTWPKVIQRHSLGGAFMQRPGGPARTCGIRLGGSAVSGAWKEKGVRCAIPRVCLRQLIAICWSYSFTDSCTCQSRFALLEALSRTSRPGIA